MATLLNKANAIKAEKDAKILPGNLKAGVTAFGVLGTYGGGSNPTPAFIPFEGNEDEGGNIPTILICNYESWEPEYVHEKLDDYLTADIVDALYALWSNDAESLEDYISDNWDPELFAKIIELLQAPLDDEEHDGEQILGDFYLEAGGNYYPTVDCVHIVMDAENSIEVTIWGWYSANITLEMDQETGDPILVVSRVENWSLNTYEADATTTDVVRGKIFAAQGELLEGELDVVDTYEATATPADVIRGKTFAAQGELQEGTYRPLVDITIDDLYYSQELGCWVSENRDAAELLNASNGRAFNLHIGLNPNELFDYVATMGEWYNPDTEDLERIIRVLTTDDDHSDAHVYLTMWNRGVTEREIELRDIEFQIQPVN